MRKTHLHKYYILSIIILLVFLFRPLMYASVYGADYRVVFRGQDWLDGKGIDVIYPISYDTNSKWQCVEFVLRFYHDRLGYPNPWSNGSDFLYAYQIVDMVGANPKPGLEDLKLFDNGSTTPPAKYDIMVWGKEFNGNFGHVAIVTSVIDNQVRVMQQNMWDNNSYPMPTSTLSMQRDAQGRYTVSGVKGWIHSPRAPSSTISTPTPKPGSTSTPTPKPGATSTPTPVPPCEPPSLQNPEDKITSTSATITFRWSSVACSKGTYVLRIKTAPGMNAPGNEIYNIKVSGTEHSLTIAPEFYNRQLYWSVIAEVPGGQWATERLFHISPNEPPHISFDTANGQPITINNQDVWGDTPNWSFTGTASDKDGRVDRVDVLCEGDSCPGRKQLSSNGTTNWSAQASTLIGKNEIFAFAYDDKSASSPLTDKHRITMYVDVTPPSTGMNINGEPIASLWPAWFTGPVQVRLSALDNPTFRALAGVAALRYQLDGQGWIEVAGSNAIIDISTDGRHSFQYYAIDKASNVEATRTINFNVDRTPPTAIAGLNETHGVVNGQWQNTQGLPSFSWAASSDPLSSVDSYDLRLEEQGGAGELITALIPAEQQLTWTPNKPAGLRTGSYLLRGRVSDRAGNWSAWKDLFSFRYDKTPPQNPVNVTHTAGAISEVWQSTVSTADFQWPLAYDEGSGVRGYYVAWGTDPDATSTTFITENAFKSTTALCGSGSACTGYLRLRSVDKTGNQAERWSTSFVLRYDNAPPTVDFSFAEGSITSQSRVTLRIAGDDQGSGVKAMRFSHDGVSWSEWEAYATERLWEIPGISRQTWPVFMQVRDGVGLESPVVSHPIYLDVNPQQPVSQSYRLFNRALSAGSGAHSSTNYQARGTLGQVIDSARLTSAGYSLVGGYEAASRAIPLVVPGYDRYQLISGIFASGSGSQQTHSGSYQLVSTFGETALPNNVTEIQSSQYRHQPGFLAGAYSVPALPAPAPGPAPKPEPALACAFPTITVNNAALFTNNTAVTLNICAPKASEMMLSNDGGFVGAQWEPYATTKAWTITTYGQKVLPRYVYAAFKDTDGTIHSVYFDDIIYDRTPPAGTLAVKNGLALQSFNSSLQDIVSPALLATQPNGTIALRIDAIDDNSGIADVQLSQQPDFAGASWQPYASEQSWLPTGADGQKTLYVRFRDSAGNVSNPSNTRFILDRQSPVGGMALGRRVVGTDIVTSTVYLGAQDSVGSVTDMRLSTKPDLADAVWQPYATELTWPIIAPTGKTFSLYVQYRDQAGNLSPIYQDTAQIDVTAPVVYAEAAGTGTTHMLSILAYDEFSDIVTMRLSNDPLMIDGVVTKPYAPSTSWTFDDRMVVWVKVKDGVGNWSEPYPVFAGSTSQSTGKIMYLPLVGR